MTNEKAIAEKLLHIGAVKLSPDAPFTWASGWKSPIYCDNRKLLSFPYERDYVKSELCSLVFEKFGDAEAIAGVATAGISWGALIADQLKLPFIYVRPKPKEHGMGNQIEGDFSGFRSVVVIEDLLSTGNSSYKVCKLLQDSGLEVAGLVSIFTYGFPQADKLFAEAGIPTVSAGNYNALVEVAVQKGIIKPEQAALLAAWREAPEAWGQ